MKKLLYLISISALVLSCGSSQNQSDTKNKAEKDVTNYANSITANELKEALYVYASDDFEGRETGQPGQKKAVEYLKNTYISLGIPSALPNNDYFQEVPLQIMKAPSITLSTNGNNFKAIEDFVSVTTSIDGNLNENEIVYAAYGIEDEKYSNYNNLDVKDKVVLIKSGEPKDAAGNYIITGTKEASKWSNFRQAYVAKKEVAEAKGAKAVLLYDASVYNMVANYFGGDNDRMSLKGENNNLYYLLINTKLAEAIHPNINSSEKIETLKSNLKLNYKNETKNFESENVAAFIKGSEKPDEIIVISSHLDHEGVKEGKVYNGADDDGSGSVAMLEIAEAFQEAVKNGQGPKRSILFLHVTAEEKGLLGSSYYTDVDPIFPLENTVANLNIDMIGRTDPKRESTNRNYLYLIGSDKLSTELHDISEAINTKYCNIELDYTFNDENDPNRFYYRSDHYNFAKNNIPVIFYFNGTHDDYHKPTDTPDKIEYDLLENRSRLIFHTAWELANRENRIIVDKAGK